MNKLRKILYSICILFHIAPAISYNSMDIFSIDDTNAVYSICSDSYNFSEEEKELFFSDLSSISIADEEGIGKLTSIYTKTKSLALFSQTEEKKKHYAKIAGIIGARLLASRDEFMTRRIERDTKGQLRFLLPNIGTDNVYKLIEQIIESVHVKRKIPKY